MLGRDVLTGQTTGMRRDEICHSVVKERKMVVKEVGGWSGLDGVQREE